MKFALASTFAGVAAAGCTGSGEPDVSQPRCYHGKAGALGLTESVDVTLKDFAAGNGHIDVSGGGIEDFSCSNHAFSKSGQAINTDLTDCVPTAITVKSVKYCSDDDTVQVTVADKAVPLPITATLKKVDCGSAVESAMDSMWNEFQSANPQNGDERRSTFEENVAHIIAENKKDQGYYLGVNQFTGMTTDEFANLMLTGLKPKEEDKVKLGVRKYSGAALPDEVDWSTKGSVTPVKDQGSCGSCWAFSTTGALEGRAQLAKGDLTPYSEQELVDCDKDFGDEGCNGGLMDNAFQYVMANGISTEDSYTYSGRGGNCAKASGTEGLKAGEVTGYVDVDASEDALAEAVAEGPVSVAVQANTIFQFYSGGIMGGPCGASLDHGVLAVGYGVDSGTKYWKVKNSWGARWGENGYLRMKKGKGGKGQCGILTGPPSYPQFSSSVEV